MKIIRGILVIIGLAAVIIAVVVILPFLQRGLGYYPGNTGWEVAEITVRKGKTVDECRKIIGVPWIGIGPSTEEQRMNCIHEYAELAKDPTACSLLMPSDYGLSCINQSFHGVFTNNPDDENVDIDADCSIYNSNPIRKDYCFFSQAHRSKDLNTCKEIKNPTIQSACNEKIGAWYKYPELRTSTYFGKYREP